MITTAGTVTEAARVVTQHGAARVIAAATHPVLVGPALQRLSDSPISRVVTTNTIPDGPRVEPIRHKLVQLCVSRLLAEAIHRTHHNMSISALFRQTSGVKR